METKSKQAEPKFELGQVLFTVGATELQKTLGKTLWEYVLRHECGDWGDLGIDDSHENDHAVENGFRIFSAYKTDAGKIWIITESDRSVTTVLLPTEYQR